jgi:hypothetical protein
MLQDAKTAVERLVSEHVKGDIEKEKVYQYSEARRHESYWRGLQYLKPVVRDGVVVDYTPSGVVNPGTNQVQDQYNTVVNVIRGDGRKFVAVLGQRSPNVKAAPDRSDNETMIRRSRKADVAAQFLRSAWKVDSKHRHLAMSLWKNGTTFGYTSWVTDRHKYGVTKEPQIEFVDKAVGEGAYTCVQCGASVPESQMQGVCPGCGSGIGPESYMEPEMVPVPEVTSVQEFDNGCVELRICSIFTVTTPFYIENLHEAPWLWYEYEEHKGSLMSAFPELESMRLDEASASDSGTSAQGRLSRDLASSPTGNQVSTRRNRWTFTRFWLMPCMYALLADSQKPIRQYLSTQFADGVRVTMVQGKVIRLDAERLTDVWSMCKPETSEYIYADAICKDFMPIQDVLNDHVNQGREMWERAIPATAVDPRIFDLKKLREHAGLPGEFIPTIPGVGARLQDSMYKLPVAEPNPQMMVFADALKEYGRENTGILKPIFGADSGNQTATEAEQKRTQALMQLNTTWNEMRDFWAATYQNGVKQLARRAAGEIKVNGSVLTEDEIADLKELLEGGWHFEAEEAMPMTWNQKRALFWSIVDKGPEAWNFLGATHPLNAAYIQENLGMTGWKTPYLAARDKALDTIRLLLQGSPMVGPMGMEPSIPVDEFEDDHAFAVQVVREWAQDEEARRERERNQIGYANVIAWGMKHQMLAAPPVQVGPDGQPMPPADGQPPTDGPGAGIAGPPPQGGLVEQPPANENAMPNERAA